MRATDLQNAVTSYQFGQAASGSAPSANGASTTTSDNFQPALGLREQSFSVNNGFGLPQNLSGAAGNGGVYQVNNGGDNSGLPGNSATDQVLSGGLQNSAPKTDYNTSGTVGNAVQISVDPNTHNITVIGDKETANQIQETLSRLNQQQQAGAEWDGYMSTVAKDRSAGEVNDQLAVNNPPVLGDSPRLGRLFQGQQKSAQTGPAPGDERRRSADANGTVNVGGANTFNGQTVVGGGTLTLNDGSVQSASQGQLKLYDAATKDELAINAPASDNKKDGFNTSLTRDDVSGLSNLGVNKQLEGANKTGAEGETETRTFVMRYASPTDVANEMATLFPHNSGATPPVNVSGGRSAGGIFGALFGGGETANDRLKKSQQVNSVPDSRTDSVVVTAPKDLMNQIATLMDQIDVPSERDQKTYAFSVTNAEPSQVVQELQGMFNSQTRSSGQQNAPLVTRMNSGAQNMGTTSTSVTRDDAGGVRYLTGTNRVMILNQQEAKTADIPVIVQNSPTNIPANAEMVTQIIPLREC